MQKYSRFYRSGNKTSICKEMIDHGLKFANSFKVCIQKCDVHNILSREEFCLSTYQSFFLNCNFCLTVEKKENNQEKKKNW